MKSYYQEGNNISRTAKALGINTGEVYRYINRINLRLKKKGGPPYFIGDIFND